MHGQRLAVVTGGASGIGGEVVRRFARSEDVTVVIVDRESQSATTLATELAMAGCDVESYVLDLLDTSGIARFWALIDEKFKRCDMLVNSAGIAALHPLPAVRLEDWNTTLGVNLTGPLLMTQGAARLMTRNAWGRVVNVSSVSGFRAGVGRTAYGTSKAGLTGLTRQLAIELAADGITVNAVAPGPVDTPLAKKEHSSATRDAYQRLVPMRRYASVGEVAAAVMFLCSEDSGYITGHTIPVDGGFLAAGVLDI